MYAYSYVIAGFDDGICWFATEHVSIESLLMGLNEWEYYADRYELVEASEWKVFDEDTIPF